MDDVSRSPLTPLRFLERASYVHPDAEAIVDGSRRTTYREMATEVTRLARALRASGVAAGDRVAILCPNSPEMLIAHFAVPLAQAVLVPINTRLAPPEIKYICDHSGASHLFVDQELLPSVVPVIADLPSIVQVVEIPPTGTSQGPSLPRSVTYAEFLRQGNEIPLPWTVDDEARTIAVNYTSGTTGRPKGVMYTHRGAYLNSLGEILHSGFTPDTRYLWTLPMFHCNGWCTTWAVTAVAGRHHCLRAVRADAIWRAFADDGITHLNGAPTVLNTIADAEQARPFPRTITMTTAGAPPSPTTIGRLEALGARIIHVYGLTETYGPYTVCEYQPGWADLSAEARARLLARQGVAMLQADPVRVVDSAMNDVPADGSTIGEIVMRGNNVMLGYFADEEATATATRGGWFHSGDLGVMHPDGYVQLVDRAKDIIVSGGENISTVEVEQALLTHPAVRDVAVVGVPDRTWGERPKAFVVTSDTTVSEEDLIEHVRSRLARYKAPRDVEFVADLPRTSTGKVQKFQLRASSTNP
jgi:fatty-acyl-CoA synthase